MRKALVGIAVMLVLTGCINSKEKKMESICKEIVLSHALDPKEVGFNEIRLLSGSMSKDEFVRNYYGSESAMSDDQRRLLELRFKDGGKGAVMYAVDIDFIDKSRGQDNAIRAQAICIYIGYGDNIDINSFTVNKKRIGRERMPAYFVTNKLPKGLSYFGRIE